MMRSGLIVLLMTSLSIFSSCRHPERQEEKLIQQEPSQEKNALSKNDSAFFKEQGTYLAKQMYFALLQHVNKAINEKGLPEAVTYCNHNALHITDSLSSNFGINAKRTSLKIRNPKNAPDSLEKQILLMYQQTQFNKPVIYAMKDSVRFFTPIYIADFCLTCHGVPNQSIPQEVAATINKLYPKDEAKNYQLYDIRGVWSITFPKNYQSKIQLQSNPNNSNQIN